MINENDFLMHAFFMGIYITFVYDILRIFRRVIAHSCFWVSLEDICFWVYCGAEVFLLMYHESNGTLRWFAVLGALMGMLLYRKSLSRPFVKYTSLILSRILALFIKIFAVVLRPVRAAGRILSKMSVCAKRGAFGGLRRFLRSLKRQLKLMGKAYKI